MNLQTFLEKKFKQWRPEPPMVIERTNCSVTMEWKQREFEFLQDQLLYKIEMKKKLPSWVVVYSGGKTSKMIDYLPPRHPHVFRLTVILKSTAVPLLSERALHFYGDENTIYAKMRDTIEENSDGKDVSGIENQEATVKNDLNAARDIKVKNEWIEARYRWVESQPSPETWTSTDTDGSSAVCFCMAVCCGYIKQVQSMLEERPELIGIVNPNNGFTPLAGAVKKGDLNTVKFLLSVGAEVEQRSDTGQTPLQLAVLAGDVAVAGLLIEHGADIKSRDRNQLRAEHYAVDSGNVAMLEFVMERGGDLSVIDSNGWTPLFRALTQNGRTDMITELVARGSDVNISDAAGLPLLSVARLLTNRHGRSRDSVLRVVDRQFPHERALALFTRLTKKIHHVHTVFK
ncbi:fibronectin type 3 and ankyrin repeat domains 1 protein-like [Plodia interpunctella]|uniref:fibronectin type 3 and ankyrin repeat domains 1 protein-like n=1 Tax=Plodia interpunctella TaxID=58824 RepID=UPI0023682BCB|nr:fibronectin type 3 and ankyrin repeat domains 1 protein-like [Plodia interpunctella]